MRLADRIAHDLKAKGASPVIVSIDNVAKYYFEGTDQDVWKFQRDFPNIAPPWPLAIYQMRTPDYIRTPGQVTRVTEEKRELAAGVTSFDLLDSEQYALGEFLLFKDRDHLTERIRPIFHQARWLSFFHLFFGPEIFPSIVIPVFIDKNGTYLRPFGENCKQMLSFVLDPVLMEFESSNPTIFREWLESVIGIWLHPYLLAITFTHCKNTTIRDIIPPPKLNKRTIERHGIALNTYKVLEIEPVIKILRDAAEPGVSLPKRLHICRGHFKDYRQHGLFGRLTGLYWWGQHIRGQKSMGQCAKDYSLSMPH